MQEPRRIWWARPRKLCALERPGGGGRSHRPERRAQEIAYLIHEGVRMVVSTMATRHNLAYYEEAGLDWHHVPVQSAREGADALEELLPLLRRELRRKGAVAVHGNRHTDFVAAVCAAHLHEIRGVDPTRGLGAAGSAGLVITPEACALLGVDYEAVQPRSAIAAAT
jgi:MoaA/NifB/PqqE/SkfB family radical SAM enzyme